MIFDKEFAFLVLFLFLIFILCYRILRGKGFPLCVRTSNNGLECILSDEGEETICGGHPKIVNFDPKKKCVSTIFTSRLCYQFLKKSEQTEKANFETL